MSVATTGKPSIRPIAASTALALLPIFTRTGSATRINELGYIENVPANTPRIDYSPTLGGGATATLNGLLIEEARTNLLLFSGAIGADGSPSAWTTNGSTTITANSADAPDGTTTAALISVTASNGRIMQQVNGVTNGGVYAFSCFLKSGSITAVSLDLGPAANSPKVVADLFLGTVAVSDVSPSQVISATIERYGSYYRVTGVFLQIGPTALLTIRNESGGAGNFYAWGAQLEACGAGGQNSTSYIPTTAAAVSRGADNFTLDIADAVGSTLSSANHSRVFLAEFLKLKLDATSGTARPIWSAGNVAATISSAIVALAPGSAGSRVYTAGANSIAAASSSAFRQSLSVGGAASESAVVFSPTSGSTLYLGYRSSTGQYLNGHLRRIVIYGSDTLGMASDANLATLSGGVEIDGLDALVSFDFTETDIEEQTGDLDLPRFAYHDLARDATVSASSEASSAYPADAAQRPDTYEKWQPGANALPAWWQASLGSAQFVNYMFIAAHDLGSRGCSVKARFSGDGGNFLDASDSHTPEDDSPILLLFSDQLAPYWQLYISGGSPTQVPTIGVIKMGQIMVMPYKISGGFAPPNLSRQTEIIPALSKGGNFLGQDIKRSGLVGSASFRHLDPDWYRDVFDLFVQDARSYPYGFAWRPGSYPDDVSYVYSDADIRPSNMGIGGGLMSVSVPMKGYDSAP